MEIIHIDPANLLDPQERERWREKLRKEIQPKDLQKIKEVASGKKAKTFAEAENARYILFLLGESYAPEEKPQAKPEGFWHFIKKHIPFTAKQRARLSSYAENEEKERYAQILRTQKTEGIPTNFTELRGFLYQQLAHSYLTFFHLMHEGGLIRDEGINRIEEDFRNKSPQEFIQKYRVILGRRKILGIFGKETRKLEARLKRKQLPWGKKYQAVRPWLLWKEWRRWRKIEKRLPEEKRREAKICLRHINDYTADLRKIESILEKAPSEKEKAMEQEVIGPPSWPEKKLSPHWKRWWRRKSYSLLAKYNPALAESARRLTLFRRAHLGRYMTPTVERALLEIGRPDLVYGPERLAQYLERMDREGLPVSKLSPEVWKCAKAIDALSDAQLYELATGGSAAAVANLREMVAKNPWLLIGNKNPGGRYQPRRGTGVSKFVLKSAFELDPRRAEQFFFKARQIMPSAVYQNWTSELLKKYTAEDIMGFDVSVFRPQLKSDYEEFYEIDEKGRVVDKETKRVLRAENLQEVIDPDCLFMVFTRNLDPGHLAGFSAQSALIGKAKPLIIDYLIANRKLYRSKETQKVIEKIEAEIYGLLEARFTAEEARLQRDIGTATDQWNNLEEEEKVRLAGEFTERLDDLEDLSRRLPENTEWNEQLEGLKEQLGDLGIQSIEPQAEAIFNPQAHQDLKNPRRQGGQIARCLARGWQLGNRILKKAIVEIQD